jgi:drug/metabolite transporter, DME family
MSTEETGHRRGELLVLAAAALFSTGGAVLKSPSLSHAQVAGFRSGIAVVAMLLFVPAARRGWTPRALLVALPCAATFLLFVFATRLTTAADAIFLQSAAPLWLLALSPWLLRERIGRADLVFMGALGAGLALLFAGAPEPTSTAPDPALGNLLGAASGVTWALTVAGLRWLAKDEGRHGSAAAATVGGNLVAFLAMAPFAFPVVGSTAGDWLGVGYLGVLQIGLAYTCLTVGVRRVPAFEASLLLLLEPVLNPLWAWLVHDERPGPLALAGGVVVVVSTAVYTVARR